MVLNKLFRRGEEPYSSHPFWLLAPSDGRDEYGPYLRPIRIILFNRIIASTMQFITQNPSNVQEVVITHEHLYSRHRHVTVTTDQ